ncbi:hypothetical protein [Kitasatospora sp. NPDC092286]|uniref:hypothetical protein n=1 Tax=Kitasatospora sp. NPDC092286 TaxID=3364087 RepID=UPI00381F7772
MLRRLTEAAVLGGWWLSQTTDDPDLTRQLWRQGPLAEIPVGIRFNIIRMSSDLGRAAIEDMQSAGLPQGPVLLDHSNCRCDWLVTIRPTQVWGMRGTELLTGPGTGSGTEALTVPMPVPGVGRVDHLEWLVEPDGTGLLTRPEDLAVAIRRSRERLRQPTATVP